MCQIKSETQNKSVAMFNSIGVVMIGALIVFSLTSLFSLQPAQAHTRAELQRFNQLLSPILIERVSGTDNNTIVQNVIH